MVEHLVANERVEGSNLFSRSKSSWRATLGGSPSFGDRKFMDAKAAIKAAEEYRNNGQSDQAARILLRAIQANPTQGVLYSLLAYDLDILGKREESLQYAQKAVKLSPTVAQFHNNLACSYMSLKRFAEAEPVARECLRLDPRFFDGFLALAGSLEGQGKMAEAVDVGRQAIASNPYRMEGYGAMGQAYRAYGAIEDALEVFRDGIKKAKPDLKLAMAYVFTLNMSDRVDEREIQEATKFHSQLVEQIAQWRNSNFPHDRSPDRRLKIGYVSPDFRIHSVASFIEPILLHRDREAVHVTLYYRHVFVDSMTHHLRKLADDFKHIFPMTLDKQYDLVRQDNIDILVDLSGLTEGNSMELFARKPAPIEVTMIGYCNSTGLQAIDYRVVDERTDPPGSEPNSTESLARLPGSFLVYQVQKDAPPVGPLPFERNGFFTFGSFNQVAKLTPATVHQWSRVLLAVPNSKIILKSYGLDVQAAQDRLIQLFAENGVESDRLDLRNARDTIAEHLGTYNEVDVALDSFPYHGTTTTCEALSMGVPVVTHYGQVHRSRVGLSLVTSIGHPEWASDSFEGMVEIVQGLVRDPVRLAQIRARLREELMTSRLCDGPAHCRELESFYRQAWQKWCREAPPVLG